MNHRLHLSVAVNTFPKLSETFILNHIVGLLDLGHEVNIISRHEPSVNEIHEKVHEYNLLNRVHYVGTKAARIRHGPYRLLVCLKTSPLDTIRTFNVRKDWKETMFLRTLSMAYPIITDPPDLLHVHFGPVANDFQRLTRLTSCPPLVVSFHGWGLRKGEKEGPGYYKDLFNAASAIISNSEGTTKRLHKLGAPADKIYTVPIGIDTDAFCPAKGENNGEIIITTVGRLSAEKGHRDAIRAIRYLSTLTETPVSYRVVGDGDMRGALEELAEQIDVADSVCFTGALKQQQVIRELNQADICLLPSHDEGLGVASLEAQACGVPVVVTDVGGLPETVLDDESGIVIPPESPDEIANAINELIRDPALREKLGRRGREFVVNNYSHEVMIDGILSVYRQVLSRG